LISVERELQDRLELLDKQVEKKLVSKVLKEEEVQMLLRMVGDSAPGSVGPQHWLCERLWSHLSEYYEQKQREEDACRMQRLRVDYARKGYPSLHGELAWLLEAEADLLCRTAGLGTNQGRAPGLHDSDVRRIAQRATVLLTEGCKILERLFGPQHNYYVSLEKKREKAQLYAETGKKRKRSNIE